MQQRLPKFRRDPSLLPAKQLTARSLQIIAAIHTHRFIPTSLLVRLTPGNAKVTSRHLQVLFHHSLISRFSFPRQGFSGEFIYFLENPLALKLLAEHAGIASSDLDFEQLQRNREKRYNEIQDSAKNEEAIGRAMFLKHELAITRFHVGLTLACRETDGKVKLASWRQGPELWDSVDVPRMHFDRSRNRWVAQEGTERLPHRPDAAFTLEFPDQPEGENRFDFFYEADRKTEDSPTMLKKLRAYFAYVVKERRHQSLFGIRRIRAVLIETLDTKWAEKLRETARHPLVCGEKPSPLFWVTASSLFTKEEAIDPGSERPTLMPRFLINPMLAFKPVWLTAVDDTLHSLLS